MWNTLLLNKSKSSTISKNISHFTNKCNGVNSLRLHNLSDDTVSVMLKTNACWLEYVAANCLFTGNEMKKTWRKLLSLSTLLLFLQMCTWCNISLLMFLCDERKFVLIKHFINLIAFLRLLDILYRGVFFAIWSKYPTDNNNNNISQNNFLND